MTAKKRHKDHGGVLTIRQALYHAVHDYRNGAGLPSFCADFGVGSAAYFGQKINLRDESASPTLRDFELILDGTQDSRILTAVCEPVGAAWSFRDELPEVHGDLGVLERGTKLMISASAVIDELVKGLADGELDVDEMARVRQKIHDLQRDMQLIRQTADQFVAG